MPAIRPTRRHMLAVLGASGLAGAWPARAQTAAPLAFATAGPGSAFLAFGNAAAPVAAAQAGLRLDIRQTKGSNENAALVSRGEVAFATLNLGPGFDAWNGRGPFAGQALRGMRAVVPMYETPFHTIALARSNVATLRDLEGKRVGVGPAGGPGEVFFKGITEALGIRAEIVNGDPDALARRVGAGEIDAFWYGSGLPSPPFKSLAEGAETRVIGFTPEEAEAFRRSFAYFAPYTIPAGTYRGQKEPLRSLAVWNFVVAHEGVPADIVRALAKALIEHRDAVVAAFPTAAAMDARNLSANTFMPFHPGAVRYFTEAGIAVPDALKG